MLFLAQCFGAVGWAAGKAYRYSFAPTTISKG